MPNAVLSFFDDWSSTLFPWDEEVEVLSALWRKRLCMWSRTSHLEMDKKRRVKKTVGEELSEDEEGIKTE